MMRTRRDFPNAWQALALTVATVFAMFALALGWDAVAGAAGPPSDSAAGIAAINATALALVLLYGWRRSDELVTPLFRFEFFSPTLLAPLLLLVLGASIVLSDLDNAVQRLWPVPRELAEFLQSLLREGPVTGVVLLVVAPVGEELLFRGMILRGLIANHGVSKAILGSSLLFAAVHLNPWQAVPTFFVGLLLAWLFVRTRSLPLCILLHALWNGWSWFLATGAAGISIPGYTENPLGPPALQPVAFTFAGALLLAVGFFWLKRRLDRDAQRAL